MITSNLSVHWKAIETCNSLTTRRVRYAMLGSKIDRECSEQLALNNSEIFRVQTPLKIRHDSAGCCD
jgi:hypothetical protein